MSGREAWNSKGRGGTLKRLEDGTTPPGPFYLLAISPAKLVGSAGRNALRDGLVPSLDNLAVYYGVKAIQKLVNLSGASPQLSTDGVFGKGTEAGVKAFQKKVVIKEDGSVGPTTMKRLLLPHIKKMGGTTLIGGQPKWTVIYGFLANEGGWDPGCVGYYDEADLGLAQINGRAWPEYTVAQRFDPIFAIQFNVDYLNNALAQLNNNLRDAVLSYNLGVGGTKRWIAAGRPRYWDPQTLTSSSTGGGSYRDTTKYIDNILNEYKELN